MQNDVLFRAIKGTDIHKFRASASGVVRVPYTGGKIILHPIPTKTAKFEVINRRICSYFRQ